MTLKADGVAIATSAWNVTDAAQQFSKVTANGVEVWLRTPDTPATISYPSATTVGNNVTVSWAAALRAANYTLEQKINSGSWTTVGTFAGTSTSVTVNTVATYTFRVKANNSGGSSSYKTGGGLVVAPNIIQENFTVTLGQYAVAKNATLYGYSDGSTDSSNGFGGINDTTYRGVTIKAVWRRYGTGGGMNISLSGNRVGWIKRAYFQGWGWVTAPAGTYSSSVTDFWFAGVTPSSWDASGTRTMTLEYEG
ncbi:fibronectin type III domain-containing protein [Dasania sp. GY-MA-18]|uniref:Fibronectin type III domain-containing protein n=1 Tax=Dasania phycosphaerae TaxID=2950436 RepID=A0A9J6RLN9_9GAMM|nr:MULTISPECIES: fibronectin type III domain-containing protein [Dasania]MCR8922673.1 fibronectin type III domain-containing protein [Dasania sp. GY-MA-18]MCZ0865103.1 fibronectin type III domain-containing protein [Dasania phycosphaerae]MCZ0868829.1 fibronectin type III domain-containing protein [Dasania phycosphaerae]